MSEPTAPVLSIAVIGAECTGKTTLCRLLAEQFGGLWVPEALREFVDRHGRPPTADEQAALMDEQIAREAQARREAAVRGSRLSVFDSAPLATALYSRLYYADDRLLAAATAHHRRYDALLVTDTDLPWEPDGLQRDGPQMRERFHTLLIEWLAQARLPHALIGGVDDARLAQAVRVVDQLVVDQRASMRATSLRR